MTEPTPLSPAAQAVLDAAQDVLDATIELTPQTDQVIAAAIRAAADQVVPWRPEPTKDSVGPTIDYGFAWALFSKAKDVREKLIAIAAELDGTNGPSENV